jgi:CubicO group peptidase (beta-lactamase class C family)
MKKNTLFGTLIIFSVLMVLPLSAQEMVDEIDKLMNEFVSLDLFSGTVLVAKDGNILYTKAFGEADKDFHVKNTLKTKYNIGSIGKIFTGTLIMQLAENGKLNVMEPVKKYLPDFPFGEKILIHHLLTHTSGTYNYFAHPDFAQKVYTIRSINDALPLIYDQELRFDTPGQQFSYSNSGILILGAVIEKLSGMYYPEYLQKHILGPLEMHDTGINFLEEVVENRAVGYDKRMSGEYTRNIFRMPPASADGGLETTVLDMLKFDQALYGTSLLSEDSKKKMFTPFLEGYGYCWGIREEYNNFITSHSGGTAGVSAVFRRYTTDRYTLVVLSNYGGAATSVANTLEAIIFDQEYQKPQPSLGEYFYKIMSEKGISYFIGNYEEILNEEQYEIRSSNVLNRAGYELLFNRQIDMAIALFKVNILLFPEDANIHDSLGEGYMVKGDYKKSREMYLKALELDPDFENAKKMLPRLDELEKENSSIK